MKSHQKSILGPKRVIQRSHRTSLPRSTRTSKSINGGGESSEPILPTDLIIEIFSRLSAKSIARFLCVSKLCTSMIHSPYFTELFFTRSSSRPQVLFTFRKYNEAFFFSIPQTRNHDELVSPVVATFVTKTPFRSDFGGFSNVNGLVFLREWFYWSSDRELSKTGIFNPTTRQTLSIPNLNLNCFMGYDPIEKHYKILSITERYQVLTLGSGNLLWRDILCCIKHNPRGYDICIDGVLYYLAVVKNDAAVGYIMIVSFDIKSEKFSFIKTMENYNKESNFATLINYNGKLGSVRADDFCFVNGSSKVLKIWVLEDPKNQEWSQHIHLLPPFWRDVVGVTNLNIVGVIGTDEIVLSSIYVSSSFYLIYYNMKKKSVIKVEIQGMEASRDKGVNTFLNQCMEDDNCIVVRTFLNHAENLKLLS